jgi:phage anti-repressor protein
MDNSLSNLDHHSNSLSFEIASRLYESDGDFPINFEIAWQWLGYTRKDSAKKKLLRNFVESLDYTLRQVAESAPNGGLTHWEDIWLSVNCLKEMGMLANTSKGKEVRSYFLQCEALAKQSTKAIPRLELQIQQLQESFNHPQSQVQKILPPSSDFIPPGWDANAWGCLPPQDKRHFRIMYQNFGFHPDEKPESLSISAEARIQQRQEVERIIGEISHEETWRIEDAKQELLARFWGQEDE